MSIRTQKLRKWSSFGHRFGHRSELPLSFEFLRCVHFVHDISFFGTQLLNFECFWRLRFVPILTCWMNVFKFKNLQTCVSKSSFFDVFCVTPIVPESFMIVSSTNVLVKLFLMVGGFGGRSYDHSHCPKCISLVCRAWTPCLSAGTTDGCSWPKQKSAEIGISPRCCNVQRPLLAPPTQDTYMLVNLVSTSSAAHTIPKITSQNSHNKMLSFQVNPALSCSRWAQLQHVVAVEELYS